MTIVLPQKGGGVGSMGLTVNTERTPHEDEGRGLANEPFKIDQHHKKLGEDLA